MTTLVIGAPSQQGKDANAQAKQLFGSAAYPLEALVQNAATFDLVLPEARLDVKALGTKRVVFADFARLQRTVSSLAQIARLNSLPVIAYVTIAKEEEVADSAAPDAETVIPVTVIQDDEAGYVVELDGVRFEPNRNQVRQDGTLTAGGIKALETAKASALAYDKE